MNKYVKPPVAVHKNRLYGILYSNAPVTIQVDDICDNCITLKHLMLKWKYNVLYIIFKLKVKMKFIL